jgi:hypothetical protein
VEVGSWQQPPLSPNLVPLDIYLFTQFKNFSSGKRFEDQNTLHKTGVKYFTHFGNKH